MGPVRSLKYLGGDDILVLGQVFGIYSDMEALDYLTVASLKYGETSYDCNYLWPFNLYEAIVVSEDTIIVSADHRRVVRWDGRSGTSVDWQATMDVPAYLINGSLEEVAAISRDLEHVFKISLRDASVTEPVRLPFRVEGKPQSIGADGFLISGEGNIAFIHWDLAEASRIADPRIRAGSRIITGKGGTLLISGGMVARIGF